MEGGNGNVDNETYTERRKRVEKKKKQKTIRPRRKKWEND